MHKRRFVIRTIKDGQVKIYGRVYKPSTQWLEYDGRLDGQRWAFGLYWSGDQMEPYVNLWGAEEAYRAASNDEKWNAYCKSHPMSPAAIRDGDGVWYYPWTTWHAVST